MVTTRTAMMLVLVAGLIATPMSEGLTTYECYAQCYQTYLQLYQRYCIWGQICGQVTQALANFYISCYQNCNTFREVITSTMKPTTTPMPNNNSPQCGMSLSPKIIGGTKAFECELPWTVSINIGSSFCGGSILDSNTVITAAHCVYSSSTGTGTVPPSSVSVLYGSSSQNFLKNVGVSHVLVHPKYVPTLFDYDVALLTLATPLTFNRCTSPICLPSASADPSTTDGCLAAGWGALLYSAPSKQIDLQRVLLPIVPLSQCQAAYASTTLISSIKICAGDLKIGGIDACLGDSGGPLMCLKNGVYSLYGIVSFGKGCAEPGYPGVYSNVAHPDILSWVRTNM